MGERGADSTQSICTNQGDSPIVLNNGWKKVPSRGRLLNEDLYDGVDDSTDQETSRRRITTSAPAECTDENLRAAQLNQPIVSSIPTLQIIVVGTIGKEPPEFEGKKRDHMIVHTWVHQHRRFHMLNPQIVPAYRTMHSAQYLSGAACMWFASLGQRFEEPGDHFDEFVQLFLAQWDEFNWRDEARFLPAPQFPPRRRFRHSKHGTRIKSENLVS
ncbi:hypothetical protein MMC08_003409 [Hypocenomyce scalaris]|nr:hypothetical protein [Hypocenomyce scalaris]